VTVSFKKDSTPHYKGTHIHLSQSMTLFVIILWMYPSQIQR